MTTLLLPLSDLRRRELRTKRRDRKKHSKDSIHLVLIEPSLFSVAPHRLDVVEARLIIASPLVIEILVLLSCDEPLPQQSQQLLSRVSRARGHSRLAGHRRLLCHPLRSGQCSPNASSAGWGVVGAVGRSRSLLLRGQHAEAFSLVVRVRLLLHRLLLVLLLLVFLLLRLLVCRGRGCRHGGLCRLPHGTTVVVVIVIVVILILLAFEALRRLSRLPRSLSLICIHVSEQPL
mmetsp:Transcript_70838/g.140413  ORF Transcript_70838/g.140413 Transcript_70838/m.140413 type:complete len:232 (+) Transcript_70838:355-1050(+)